MARNNQNDVTLINIMKILMKYTDEQHPMTIARIKEKLENDYQITIERAAIGRKLASINEADICVEKTDNNKGWFYNDRKFEEDELRLLIDSVLSSRHISTNRTKQLIDKLCSDQSDNFKSTLKHIRSAEKWDNNSENIFYRIHDISRAIDEHKVIYFKMLRRDENLELVKSKYVRMSPYTMLQSNQHYYVMGYSKYWQNMAFIRIDKIDTVHVDDDREHEYIDIHSIRGYENGIDYNELSVARPYLFSDKLDWVTLKAKKGIIDQVVDWYGTKIEVKPIKDDEDYVLIKLKTSPDAMKYWALQYINDVEVVSPTYIREEIGKSISANLSKYKDVIEVAPTKVIGANSSGAYVFANFEDDLPVVEENNGVENLTEGLEKNNK